MWLLPLSLGKAQESCLIENRCGQQVYSANGQSLMCLPGLRWTSLVVRSHHHRLSQLIWTQRLVHCRHLQGRLRRPLAGLAVQLLVL